MIMFLLARSDVHPLEATLSVVGTVAAAIILLTLFFRFLSWWDGASDKISRIDIAEAIESSRDALTTVHLGNGKCLERVKIVGVTGQDNGKRIAIWQLHDMLILEHEDSSRTLIHAKSVRMIEIPPA